MRGFKNFKGSDASGPSMYSYSMTLLSKIIQTNNSHSDAKLLKQRPKTDNVD